MGKQSKLDGQTEQPKWQALADNLVLLLELVSPFGLCSLTAIQFSFEHCQDPGNRKVHATMHDK